MRVIIFSIIMLTFTGCVTVQDKKFCSVAGVLSAGANCTHFLTNEKEEMNFDQFLEFLEPRYATPTTTEKGAAVCFSSDDFTAMKNEVEIMCRMLGDRCSYATQKALGIIDTN